MPAGLWQWVAHGKHPVARDFFTIGDVSPLFRAFFSWVDEGVETLPAPSNALAEPRFYRFWARGPGRRQLLCGVVRNSCDSLGRTSPLLVMGAGILDGWENHWDLLPGACEKAWHSIEYLCTRNPPDLAGMERELPKIRPPEAEWRDYHKIREPGLKDIQNSPIVERMEVWLKSVREEQEFRMELDNGVSDQLILAGHILSRIKSTGNGAPNTVFIGGTFDVTSLVIYWRPLVVGDFIALWG